MSWHLRYGSSWYCSTVDDVASSHIQYLLIAQQCYCLWVIKLLSTLRPHGYKGHVYGVRAHHTGHVKRVGGSNIQINVRRMTEDLLVIHLILSGSFFEVILLRDGTLSQTKLGIWAKCQNQRDLPSKGSQGLRYSSCSFFHY